MPVGRIVKGIGGFYYILSNETDSIVECKARGKIRSEKLTPMIGDLVNYSTQDTGLASLDSILPRKNSLVRPPVSNIDQLIIVLSSSVPEPDWLLIDKLILQASLSDITPILVLNKSDIAEKSIIKTFSKDYSNYFKCHTVSAKTEDGLDSLKNDLKNKISCFCGQSAVGKSSLLNALLPSLFLETGELSKKTDRGKHTTRRAELWPAFGGAIMDTPGFSLFDAEIIDQETLNRMYPEFAEAGGPCQFSGCRHISEPGCKVRSLVDSGLLSQNRYDRYKIIVQDIEMRRKHKYD